MLLVEEAKAAGEAMAGAMGGLGEAEGAVVRSAGAAGSGKVEGHCEADEDGSDGAWRGRDVWEGCHPGKVRGERWALLVWRRRRCGTTESRPSTPA